MRRANAKLGLGVAALLAVIPAMAGAEGIGGYAGAGLGASAVAYGSSGLAIRIFGGYKIHAFPVQQAGAINLAIQGEYVDFSKSTLGAASWTNSGIAVAGVGSWVIPRKWAGWADEKIAVIAKVGGARVSASSNNGFSYTYTGATEGVGAEYRLNPAVAIRAMLEFYPNGYQVHGLSGVFSF